MKIQQICGKSRDYVGRTVAHNDSLDLGRETDWASHDIEHELSGIYDIAHGAGLSIVFPAWMKYVYKENKPRFEQFAYRVFGNLSLSLMIQMPV